MNIFRKKNRPQKRRNVRKLLVILIFVLLANQLLVVERIVDLWMNDKKIDSPVVNKKSKNLSIHFLNVGQSESILVTQGKHTMLIDTSTPDYGNAICQYLKKQGIKKLDVLILTHPHIDHVGGASKVLRTMKVKKVYFSNTHSILSPHTLLYLNTRRICLTKRIPIEYSVTGTSFSFGKSTITFVAPVKQKYDNLNNYSIGVKISYGSVSSLLLADAQAEIEEDLIIAKVDLNCDILKISHHGSITSNTSEFLDYVNPKYAILSVGDSNTYGHPTKTVMKRLKSRSIPVYRTDELGTVVVTTDGKHIHFNTDSGDYKYRKKSN